MLKYRPVQILLISIWIQNIHRILGSSKSSSFGKLPLTFKGGLRNSEPLYYVTQLHIIVLKYDPEVQSILFGL
jgi:hypothetical protein